MLFSEHKTRPRTLGAGLKKRYDRVVTQLLATLERSNLNHEEISYEVST